jgi:hypothetical protein
MAETPTTNNRQPKTVEARERQRDGQHKGLLHAAQKHKADNSANYATNFNHGQMASDFERSAEAAGETREEVRSHFALLDRTLLKLCGWFRSAAAALPSLPLQTDAASPRAPKLVRALGLLLWRPLRLLRTQQNWEQLAICYRLRQVRDWRQKHPELTVEQVEKFHQNLDAVLENNYWHINPRLKKIEKRVWKVWRLYRTLVGVVASVVGVRDSENREPNAESQEVSNNEPQTPNPDAPSSPEPRELNTESREPNADQAAESSGGDPSVVADHGAEVTNSESPIGISENRQSAIDNRQSLVQFRGTPHYEQFHPAWPERIDDLSPEAIADCFQSPSHVSKAQRRHSQPAALKDPKDWQEHPSKPRPPEVEFIEFAPSEVIRTPSERELRRLVRKGELTVPGSFEEFAALVEEALGRVTQPLLAVQKENQGNHSTAKGGCATPDPYLHALAESLWDRMHVFSTKVAELRELLEATLEWQPGRFLPLWLKLLPVEQAYDAVGFFNRTHGPHHADVAWGEDEPPSPRRRTPLRPYIVPRTEAEGRQKHAGELQPALRLWFWAVEHALVPALRGSHKVTVALYDWAVSRFGIREEFLQWRPKLSLAQLDTRSGRPEWAVRVVTVTGKTLVKLSDGRIFEPEE